jgi:phospholipid/cholesterol/gamma-HCH transport system ATP-binding protein
MKALLDQIDRQATASAAVSDEPTSPLAVVFDNVSFSFDEHVVLRDVSFSVPSGRMKILLGASGAGKSVVLKLILGLIRPDAGAIVVNGRRIDRLTERELLHVRADIGMLFQESTLFDSLTVAENVGYRLYEETDMPADDVLRRVQEVLAFVGLGEYLGRRPSELSGGERRRVAIARAMAAKPSLLLFDDPTTGLDPIIATTSTTKSSSCVTWDM